MQIRSEDTRQKILSSALDLFSSQGFDAAGVADICQAAGVSKGAFYHHFPSKQQVFLSLLEGWLDTLDGAFAEVRRNSPDAAACLMGMAETAGMVFQAARGHIPMYFEFWMQANRSPDVFQAAIAPYRRYQAYFSELIQAGIDEGSFKPMDVHCAGRQMTSLALGLLLQATLDPDGADWAFELKEGVGGLLEGWRAKKREGG